MGDLINSQNTGLQGDKPKQGSTLHNEGKGKNITRLREQREPRSIPKNFWLRCRIGNLINDKIGVARKCDCLEMGVANELACYLRPRLHEAGSI